MLSAELLQSIGDRAREDGKPSSPVTDEGWAAAEHSIGQALPMALRQIYDIADGGLGPGSTGLMPIEKVAADYRERRSVPFGPLGQPWPEALVCLADPKDSPLCLDLKTGAIIAWEADRIDDEVSEKEWAASFVEEADSLSFWLQSWLAEETFEQQRERLQREQADRVAAQRPSPVTGYPMQFEDPTEQVAGEIAFLADAPRLRADFGLPDDGWEDEIRRRHGLQPLR